ncbi:MAG: hypothetical protein R3C05_01245 [Pirellulaceae bacterium]
MTEVESSSGTTQAPQPSGSYRVISAMEAEQFDAAVRRGSPFAPGTSLSLDVIGQELPFEAGVWQETMIGGLLASVIMIAMGLGSLAIFPMGALIIALGGALLGMMALGTRKAKLAVAATLGNLLVLAIAFSQVIR